MGRKKWAQCFQSLFTLQTRRWHIYACEITISFPSLFKIGSLTSWQTLITIIRLYWATSSILWSGMSYSYALLSSFHVDMSAEQYPPLEHRTDIASLSRNICQSIEYCTLDENKSLGTSIVAFPMKVAIEALNDCPGCERELDWANATMAKVASVLQIMGNLPCSMTDHAYLPG
jgi:hypothetical protein